VDERNVDLVRHINGIALGAMLMLVIAAPALGQVARSSAQPIHAHALARTAGVRNNGDFMTLTLSGGAINFTLVPGRTSNPGSGSIAVQLAWACPCDAPSFALFAYFNNPAVALSDGAGGGIPTSAVLVSDNGSPFQRLNATSPALPNGGLRLVSIPALGGQRGGSHTDVLNFNIDLSGAALTHLPPGTYTGTLTIQGQAQ
jgi:hypothetical protein